MKLKWEGLSCILVWIGAQLHWLMWGYLLEFKGKNVFLQLWLAGLLFLAANTFVLIMITCRHTYSPVFQWLEHPTLKNAEKNNQLNQFFVLNFVQVPNFGRIHFQHLPVIFTQILKDRCLKILYRIEAIQRSSDSVFQLLVSFHDCMSVCMSRVLYTYFSADCISLEAFHTRNGDVIEQNGRTCVLLNSCCELHTNILS